MELQNLMHGMDWEPWQDPAGWIMQEKYNGCRVFWDGSRLWSRHGRPVSVPTAWRMPSIAIDCELYLDNTGVLACADAIKHDRIHPAKMQLVAFDAPAYRDGYTSRHSAMVAACAGLEHVRAAPCIICDDRAHAMQYLQAVQRIGGEGLILRETGLLYRPGRATSLRKLKHTGQLDGSDCD